MGKSPGKWFKAVLFGKKSSKSNLSRGKEVTKSATEKTTPVPNREPIACLPVDPPQISEPLPCLGSTQSPGSENLDNARLPSTSSILSLPKQDEEAQSASNFITIEDSQRMRLEQAATKAQAAFRGYLARRAFRTLQGIIQLQAVIRGRLVRRQAVATLYSVQGMVKFQALVRGNLVRSSDIGIEVQSKSNLQNKDVKHTKPCETRTSDRVQKFLKNAFVAKLLFSSPTVMPLRLQYGTEEPNSAWAWLLRWTVSHIWETKSEKAKKDIGLKHQRVQTEQAKAKRSGRRMQSASLENGTNHFTSDSEKTKRKPRRVSDHSASSTQGHPQNEIEKVKHSVKKVSQSIKDNSAKVKVDTEQPRRNHRKAQNLPAPEHLDHKTENPNDKPAVDMEGGVAESTDGKSIAELPTTNDDMQDHPIVSDSDKPPEDDQTGNYKDKDILIVDQSDNDKQLMDDQTGSENHKINKRRASLPAKHDNPQISLPSATKVPSYMAATESAKAKARGQVSPRFGQDAYEKNGLTRRHSLPSSTNAKLSSSPRVQRLVQASGKGGIKIDRSLSSSRDDKSIQEWRR